jgi:hypothetical protein
MNQTEPFDTEQSKCITELERQIDGLWIIVGGRDKRIEQLETCAIITAETIGQVELLKVTLVEQGIRIEKLEQEVALSKEQRLQVVANVAVITKQSRRIEKLETALETWLITVNYDTAATPPMNEMDMG